MKIKLRTKTNKRGWHAEGKLKKDKAEAFNQVSDKVLGRGTLFYPCKRGKGIHVFILKTDNVYLECETNSWMGTRQRANTFGNLETMTCPKGFNKKYIEHFEEWRCRNCNKKDIRIRLEKV